MSAVAASTEVKVVAPAPAVITLAGKVAIVTGASRGIGQGIALRLARDGAKVVVNYVKDQKSAEATVAAINTVPGSGAIAVQADVSKSADVDRLFAEAKRVYGRIDIVIANSGIAGGMNLKKEEHYKAQDLVIGNTINIFSRPCLIYDCDEFTKKWFQEVLGLKQVPIDLKKHKPTKFWQPVPPYNGFGSEEDSLGSVYSLQPKPPRKDINKMFTCDQNILRYEARLISENREDNTRTFIISFFCGDDTVQVYEHTDRNSGIWAGKFLEKKKHKNPISNNYYNEKDFVLGNIVVLNQFRFQLLRCDEFTYKYMKERPEIFKEVNIDKILDKLRTFAARSKSHEEFAIQLFKKLDKNNSGFVEFDELYVGLKELDIPLTVQEQYTIMRRFDSNGDFKLSMEELFNGIFVVKK